MQRITLGIALLVLTLFILQPICLAANARLLGMSNMSGDNMNRVTFVFDHVPEFDVDRSGQRVRVKLMQTGFAQSFEKPDRTELRFPLVQVKAREAAGESVIDLYFSDLPVFVDVTIDQEYSRFNVNVFWEKQDLGRRPAILGKRLGRLKPIQHGAVAQRVIASDYSGHWIDFFEQFEWPPAVSIPLQFSLPDFPGPVVRENAHFFPAEVKNAAASGMWGKVFDRLDELLAGNAGGRQASCFRILQAESLLRQDRHQAALEVLGQIDPDSHRPSVSAWQVYFKSYAMAVSDRHYQAARLLGENETMGLGEKGLAPWYRLLQAELSIVIDKPGQALNRLESEGAPEAKWLTPTYAIRRADAFYVQGRLDAAYALYPKASGDLRLLGQHPFSLANWAGALYQKQAYDRAYQHYYLLAESLPEGLSHHRAMAAYWGAMARLRAGETDRARLMLWEIDEKQEGFDAGFRSRLKLMDLNRLGEAEPELESVLSRYREIIETGSSRQVREEAFFKQILSCHLAGEDLRAVKLLGRFFDDYWAGALQPEAQALLVEIFPEAINVLCRQDAFFEALTLVSKYRETLAQARITYDFLFNLAESYQRAGFLEQAAATYLYILDFEKKKEQKAAAFLPLIRIFHEQKKYDQVLQYGSDYLSSYPEGEDWSDVLYHYAEVLLENGQTRSLSEILSEKNRPKTPALDHLAGRLFHEQGRYDLAAYYLTWAADAERGEEQPDIRLELGEVLFTDEKWEAAIPVFESLLDESGFAGQAGYRLIQIFLELDRRPEALNLYRQLAEKEVAGMWLDLAGETVQIERMQ